MLRLAFLWHHHQPYYRDPISGRAALPWVRLHATKDYYGMARLISEFPRMRATINIVPSLAEQIVRFAEEGASDDWLEVMAPDVGTMKDAERAKLVARGFYAHPTTMIAAFPRYQELQRKRLVGARFAKQDLVDLQVLANLAWMHATLLAEDPLLVRLREKGRDFSEEEKRALLARQREIAAGVLPMHRRLEENGQIEITSTPYFHPILPLLCDFRSAYEAMPWLNGKLGFEPVSLKEDAIVHVERALASHERNFGRRPRGMWPAEGSVSLEAAGIFASHGVKFIATDEEILAQSLGRPIRRDGNGNVLDGDVLYRPWKVKTPEGEIALVFRDHRLSDLFGFHYQRDPAGAVGDFVRRLEWIRNHAADGALVSVILDGENAWEHYPDGAVPFLRALYGRLSELEWLETVRLGDAIEQTHALETLPRLFPGSWIDHNFYIWIGHDEDRRAWRALLEARRALVEAERKGLAKEKAAIAWNAIYIAEGSDWYWWYGDDHSSGMDEIFDAIFRGQLKNVYDLIGVRVPPTLEEPIKRALAEAPYDAPRGFSRIVLDGRRTSFFEWHGAGRFRAEQEAGSMERAQAGALVEIGFGFSTEELFLALDFGGRKHTIFADGGAVHVVFITPRQRDVVVSGPGRMRIESTELTSVAVDEIVELAIPWSVLGAKAGEELRFFVEVRRDEASLERAPRAFALRVRVPSADFESREWSV